MRTIRTSGRNSASVRIRKPHLQNVLSDTNKHENTQTPTLSIEALRTIGRIIRGIKTRIDAVNRHDEVTQTCIADSGSRAAIGAMGSEDPDRAKKEKR